MKEFVSHYFYRRAASSVHISKLIPALEGGDSSLRAISKEINMSYTNLSQVMQDAHREGLIVRRRVNNAWTFTLTSKGKALCELCKAISVVIEQWDDEVTMKYLRNLNFGFELESKPEDKNPDAPVIIPAGEKKY